MPLSYDSGITSADLAQTDIFGGAGYEQNFLVQFSLLCATPVALSTVTAILRYNDGMANRSFPFTILLTTLSNYVQVVVPIILAANEYVSLEINATGLGEYRCMVCSKDMTFT